MYTRLLYLIIAFIVNNVLRLIVIGFEVFFAESVTILVAASSYEATLYKEAMGGEYGAVSLRCA